MKSLKSFLTYIVIFYFFFGGYYESYTNHGGGDLALSVFIPPWAWFRAGEALYYTYVTDDPREVCLYDNSGNIYKTYSIKEFKSKEKTTDDTYAVYYTYKELASCLVDMEYTFLVRKLIKNRNNKENIIWEILSENGDVREELHRRMTKIANGSL